MVLGSHMALNSTEIVSLVCNNQGGRPKWIRKAVLEQGGMTVGWWYFNRTLNRSSFSSLTPTLRPLSLIPKQKKCIVINWTPLTPYTARTAYKNQLLTNNTYQEVVLPLLLANTAWRLIRVPVWDACYAAAHEAWQRTFIQTVQLLVLSVIKSINQVSKTKFARPVPPFSPNHPTTHSGGWFTPSFLFIMLRITPSFLFLMLIVASLWNMLLQTHAHANKACMHTRVHANTCPVGYT
jgi:hypothetical protein